MEDLTGFISEFLKSDENREKLSAAVSALTGSSNEEKKQEKQPQEKQEQAIVPDIDPAMMLKLTSLIGKLNGKENDRNSALITALKPYLTPEHQKRADDAEKILKLITLLPELGIDFFGGDIF